jgi:glycosyltransferase involved in cell wall biosynthesis
MRIGILNNRSVQQGVRQFSSAVIEALIRDGQHDYVVLNQDVASQTYTGGNVATVCLSCRPSRLLRPLRLTCGRLGKAFPFGMYKEIRRQGLDLLVTTPTASTAGLSAGVPYTCDIPDTMHHFYPSLPEYSPWQRRTRDFLYGISVRHAVLCTVDSECGRRHVSELFGVPLAKTVSIPFVAPPYIYRLRSQSEEWAAEVLRRHRLPAQFLFYPAQFWAHKNHVRLLTALELLREKEGLVVPVVFTGSQRSGADAAYSYIQQHRLQAQVLTLGYVGDEEVAALYRLCKALVFPSLLGPTNIPIVESLVMGKPVLCSDLFAMPEQVGDAGILFDPFKPYEIAEAIRRIWTDTSLYTSLVRRACARGALFTMEDYSRQWRLLVNRALEPVAFVARNKRPTQ